MAGIVIPTAQAAKFAGGQMKRREFILALGGAAVAWPLAARAQQAGKLLTIGFLGASTASEASPRLAAFVHRLGELGWVEGRSIIIESRWAEGLAERAGEIAAEFVRLPSIHVRALVLYRTASHRRATGRVELGPIAVIRTIDQHPRTPATRI